MVNDSWKSGHVGDLLVYLGIHLLHDASGAEYPARDAHPFLEGCWYLPLRVIYLLYKTGYCHLVSPIICRRTTYLIIRVIGNACHALSLWSFTTTSWWKEE